MPSVNSTGKVVVLLATAVGLTLAAAASPAPISATTTQAEAMKEFEAVMKAPKGLRRELGECPQCPVGKYRASGGRGVVQRRC